MVYHKWHLGIPELREIDRCWYRKAHTTTAQTIAVRAHTTTFWVSSTHITDVKQLSDPHVHQGLLPITQTTSL